MTLILLVGLGGLPAASAAQDPLARTLEGVLASGRIPWSRWPDFSRYLDEVRELYGVHPGQLVWFEGPLVSRAGTIAVAALLTAGEHGLDPRDYDAGTLDRMARYSVRVPLSAKDRTDFDLLLSIGLMRLLDDLHAGRLHNTTLNREDGAGPGLDLAGDIRDAIDGDSVPELVAATAPQLAQYRNLQRILRRYRLLLTDSVAGLITERTPIRVGDSVPRVTALRLRLASLGDLGRERAADASERYTDGDAEAVRRFQIRHGLPVTGMLDSFTVAEINTPLSRRVRQIELALERLRWLPPIGRERFIVVNIPAFQLFAFDSVGGNGAPALSMKVIVGKALDKQTPVLYEQLRYIDFRPFWNVPRSILVEEVIPSLQKDSIYLRRNNMELVGAGDLVAEGPVTPEVLTRLAAGELRVRQRPGPRNALGLTKFVFPNAARVYLHGTPQPELFAHTRRDFSHGCIRLEDPAALAVWVLRGHPGWDRARVEAAQKATTTSRMMLSRPLPVVIFYTTAVASPGGSAWFYSDIYGHDRSLDEALRAGPTPP
jgi:murein L,D-transpeptidase YcbB/YkuD